MLCNDKCSFNDYSPIVFYKPELPLRLILYYKFSLPTGALKSGIYIVTLQLANGRVESKKLVLLK
ncbi:hypothetical protein GCM10009415_06350 [Chitinophaga japonensis]